MGFYCDHGVNTWETICNECTNEERRELEVRIELLESLLEQVLPLLKGSGGKHDGLVKEIGDTLAE